MSVDWGLVALFVGVLVPSIILHEVSHGWAALAFGDDTAKRAGRLTLNPVAHIDPFGTVLLPLLMSLSGVGAFGYAKPVPVNVRRLRNPRQHALYVALAGPATNLTLAATAALVIRTFYELTYRDGHYFAPRDQAGLRVVFYFGLLNVVLALFNLLPIPPLDGSALIERVLPRQWWPAWLKFRQYSFGILLLVVLLVRNLGDVIFEPAVRVWGVLVG